MASKTLVLLGLCVVLLLVSELTAASGRQLYTVKSKEETVQPNQQGYGGNGGNGAIGYGGRGNNGGGGYCRYGCCSRGYYRGCSRCCSYAGEAVQTQPGH